MATEKTQDEAVVSDGVSEDKGGTSLNASEDAKSDVAVEKTEKVSAEQLSITEKYFSDGNKLLTLPGMSLAINDDTRRLLAFFSDGRFLVSESHKFDGRVLSFEVLVRRKKLPISKPIYVSQNELNVIYSIGERVQIATESAEDYEADRSQIQKDFVNIVAQASVQKVSDIHVIVADSAQILFRVNGMLRVEMEYGKEWGESFVRAAFASADISDANYTQNEFQGAQKLGSTPLRGSKGKLMLPHNVLAIRLQFNPIAFGSQYLVMRLLYSDDNPDGTSDLSS